MNNEPFEPPVLRTKLKNKGMIIGQRKPGGQVTFHNGKHPGYLRHESPKQRKRTKELHARFEVVLQTQAGLYGRNFCQAGASEWRDRCPNNRGKEFPLVPDHVNTRNEKNPDRYENLQPLCSWCNHIKGSVRKDFRSTEFKEALQALD